MKSIKDIKTIAVHSGSFHADDVFAVAILQLINSKIEVIRTRDEKEFSKADMRVDVGMKYEENTLDFDHHQPESVGQRDNGIPYASAGLIWKHYYKYLVKTEDEYFQVDEKLIQGIDAFDVGQEIYESKIASPYTIPMLISAMNPDWQDKSEPINFDKNFAKAVKLAKNILKIEIKKVKGKSKAIKILQAAVNKNKNKGFLILERLVPWKNFLAGDEKLNYVIYEGFNGIWMAQGIPTQKDTFNIKRDFPKSWAGMQSKELSKETGIKDAEFCHRNLFLCGAKSREGIIELVKLALKN